jgi:periplasmic mercuric ion binding protein
MRAGLLERTVIGLAAALLATFGAGAAQPKRVVLDVPDMTCPLCPLTIEKTLERVPGVIGAKASFDTKRTEVTYEPDRVDPAALVRAVDAAGYHASVERR